MSVPDLTQFLKFGLTGISGMLIDFSATWVCKEKLKWYKYLSNSIGFSLAVISNFIINRNWTFENDNAVTLQFFRFLVVSVTGLAINNLLLHFFVKKTNHNFYLLKLLVIGIVFFWNYFINLFFTFK
jgi:putative flippase GtrA